MTHLARFKWSMKKIQCSLKLVSEVFHLKLNSFDIIILYDTTEIDILFQYFQVEQDYIEAQDTALPEDDEDL